MTIFTVPVVLGGGKKLFADGSAPHAYKLTWIARVEHGHHGSDTTSATVRSRSAAPSSILPANVRSPARSA